MTYRLKGRDVMTLVFLSVILILDLRFNIRRLDLNKEINELVKPIDNGIFGDDCFCPNGRQNWMFYNHYLPKGTGIGDREFIIRALLKISDQVCARLAIEHTPKELLSSILHNCNVPLNSTWLDYFSPSRRINGSLTLIDVLEEKPVHPEDLSKEVIRINDQSENGYNLARALEAEGKPFAWIFSGSFYRSGIFKSGFLDKPLETPYTETCGEVELAHTKHQLNIASFSMQQLNLSSGHYISLHIRRGDTVWIPRWQSVYCDNEPSVVINLLGCQLCKAIMPEKLLITTEYDPDYFFSFKREWKNSNLSQIELIFLEEYYNSSEFISNLQSSVDISQSAIDQFQQDNCYLFKVGEIISSLSSIHIERRRGCATKCELHPECMDNP